MANDAPPDPNEQIRLLTVRADQSESARADAESGLAAARRDVADREGKLATANERIAELEAKIAAGASAAESEAIASHAARADSAIAEVTRLKASIPALVSERAGLIARVGALVGNTLRLDSMSSRDLIAAGVKHLRPKEDIGPHVSEDYLRARFDSLYEARVQTANSMARATATTRVDSAPGPSNANIPDWREQWKLGAGQYATTKTKDH